MTRVAEKVLRIAHIREGVVCAERLFSSNESVTIGGESATFQLQDRAVVGAWFELFRASSRGWELRFLDEFGSASKVSRQDGVVLLDGLQATVDPEEPNVRLVGLDSSDRGKLEIGASLFLFQFVAPPVSPAPVPVALDFRPGLFEPEDGAYLGFLGVQSALALLLSVFVWQAEVVEVGLEETLSQMARFEQRSQPSVVLPPPIRPPEREVESVATVQRQSTDEQTAERLPEPPKQVSDPARKVRREMEQRIAAGIGRLGLIGTTGEGNIDSYTWAGSAPGIVDLDGIGSLAVDTDVGGGGLRGGASGEFQAARLDGLSSLGVSGKAEIGGGAAVVVQAKVSVGSAGVVEGGDLRSIRREVRRRSGQMKYCFESGLKRDARLGGRVELAWTVEDGRVVSAFVASNETGDDGLGQCMVAKLRKWTFEGVEDSDVQWPFVFTSTR